MSTDDPAEVPRPVIDYGTYALDQVPDWNEAAEKLIDVSCPPEALLPHFDTAEIAAKYYGKSLARRHSLAQCANRCAVCVGPAEEFAAGVGWSLTITPPPSNHRLELKWIPPEGSATFVTFHPICLGCYTAWRKRVRVSVMVLMTTAIVAVGIVLLLAMQRLLNISWTLGFSRYELPAVGMTVVVVVGFIAYATSAALDQFVWRRLPGSLRLQVHWAAKHTGHLKLIRRMGR